MIGPGHRKVRRGRCFYAHQHRLTAHPECTIHCSKNAQQGPCNKPLGHTTLALLRTHVQQPNTRNMEEQLTSDDRDLVLQLVGQLHALLAHLGLGTPPADPAAAQPEPAAVDLSRRMLEFLTLLCHPKGYRYKEIAAIMKCSTHTLRTYRDRITERHGIRGKGAFIAWAITNGLV